MILDFIEQHKIIIIIILIIIFLICFVLGFTTKYEHLDKNQIKQHIKPVIAASPKPVVTNTTGVTGATGATNTISYTTDNRIMPPAPVITPPLVQPVAVTPPPATTTPTVSQPSLNAYLDRNLYLKYTKQINKTINNKLMKTYETYYLSVSPKSSCDNIKANIFDCVVNIAVLQKVKNKFGLFNISKGLNQNTYILKSMYDKSILKSKLHLNQLTYIPNSPNYVCFDDGNLKDLFFEVEQSNNGQFRIKFKQTINNQDTYLYLSECDDQTKSICNQGSSQLPRLCLSRDAINAIYFDIETDTIEKFEMLDDSASIKANYKEVESFYSLASLVDLKSNREESISLLGAEENGSFDNYKFI